MFVQSMSLPLLNKPNFIAYSGYAGDRFDLSEHKRVLKPNTNSPAVKLNQVQLEALTTIICVIAQGLAVQLGRDPETFVIQQIMHPKKGKINSSFKLKMQEDILTELDYDTVDPGDPETHIPFQSTTLIELGTLQIIKLEQPTHNKFRISLTSKSFDVFEAQRLS